MSTNDRVRERTIARQAGEGRRYRQERRDKKREDETEAKKHDSRNAKAERGTLYG